MKKFSAWKTILGTLLLLGFVSNTWAIVGSTVTLVPTSATTNLVNGDSVTFDVFIDFNADGGTLGGGFDVVFDPAALGFVGLTSAGLGDPAFGRDPDILPGLLQSWAVGDFNGITDGLVGSVEFQVLATMSAPTIVAVMPTSGIAGPWISAQDFVTILNPEYNQVEVRKLGVCGDSEPDLGEQCDDGNSTSGDGCSAVCDVEVGFMCTDAIASIPGFPPGTPPIPPVPSVCTFEPPAPPALVFIHEIQGSGDSSPLDGETVIVEGVVTGDFQDDADLQNNLRGFYAQEEDADADADPLTSEGIFVFDGSTPLDVAVGDKVRVVGTVAEFFGETQITNVQVEILGSGTGSVSATAVTLPTAGVRFANGQYIPDLEQFEGMLVSFPDLLSVTELFNLDRFGELLLAQGGRFEQFTNDNLPDIGGLDAHMQNIASRSIMLDDGLSVQNPDPIRYPSPGLPNLVDASVRAGDSVAGLTGNVRYSRGSGPSGDETYRLMPAAEPVFTADNPRPEAAPDVGGSLRVASFNVLNYFTTLRDEGSICGPLMDQSCRGASNQAEFDRQHAKLLTALLDLDADIVGLVELENNTSASLQSIVDGINEVLGDGSYDFIDTGTIGDDAIKVGFIYRTASATPFGSHAILDSSVDPLFLDTKNRPALAQSFQEIATAGVITLAVNHLKSKGSSCNDVGDPDLGDGQGNCNGTRTDAAIALANWLATDPTNSIDADYLIMGDLNAYMQEDPVAALEDAGYINLVAGMIGPDAYSFVFDGQLGVLDHALGSAELADQVAGIAAWHINSDEADATDYNLDFGRNPNIFDASNPYRASDHDPIVVGLGLSGDLDGDGVLNDNDACPETVIPEVNVPSRGLKKNRWALTDGDGEFDTNIPVGRGPDRSYSIDDTAGCSCEQIIEALELGSGQTKFGCSSGVMKEWVSSLSQ